MRHRIPFLAAGLALVIAIAYSAWWWRAADGVRNGAEAWMAARRAEGWTVRHEAIAVDGFPFRLTLRVTRPVLEFARPALAWRWEAAAVRAEARPWRPQEVHLTVPESHSLDLRDRRRALVVMSGPLDGKGLFAAGRLQSGRLRVDPVVVAARDGTATHRMIAKSLEVTLTAPDKPVSVSLTEIMLPERAQTPLGRRIARLTIAASVTGSVEPDGGGLPDVLARWRDSGGTVEIADLRIDWPPLAISGDGTLALGADLQPIGAMTARVSGYGETIDLLVRDGAVRRRDGSVAKVVLGLMARTPANGGPPTVQTPISVQDGWLFVGRLRLMRMPPIRWTRPACLPAASAGCADRPR